MSDDGRKFYDYWINSLEYINTTMKSVRKVQNDCNLLSLCTDNYELLDKELDGFIFDKTQRDKTRRDKTSQDSTYQYMVYLPKIKMVNQYTSKFNVDNMTMQRFKIYMFQDEVNLKKKIRLERIVE